MVLYRCSFFRATGSVGISDSREDQPNFVGGNKMKQRRVMLVKWSLHLKLVYEYLLQEDQYIHVEDVQFSHHARWIRQERFRYILNFGWILFQILHIFIRSFNYDRVIIFGTNLARLYGVLIILVMPLGPRKTAFIFNELPSSDNYPRALKCIDRLLFMFYKGKCFTSSDLRSFYLKEQLGIDYTPKVLENTTVQELSDCRGVKERITDEIVYITSVSSDRLIMEPDYILPSPIKRIVLYGRITRRFSVGSIPSIYSVKGEVENRLVSTILKQYRFAFVDYDLSCINNRYSAPVKIYEYIDCCCTVVFGRMSQVLDA